MSVAVIVWERLLLTVVMGVVVGPPSMCIVEYGDPYILDDDDPSVSPSSLSLMSDGGSVTVTH